MNMILVAQAVSGDLLHVDDCGGPLIQRPTIGQAIIEVLQVTHCQVPSAVQGGNDIITRFKALGFSEEIGFQSLVVR
jgi:hypothetical protein